MSAKQCRETLKGMADQSQTEEFGEESCPVNLNLCLLGPVFMLPDVKESNFLLLSILFCYKYVLIMVRIYFYGFLILIYSFISFADDMILC